MQRSVIGTFLHTPGQGPGMNGAEHGSTAGIYDGYHHPGSARGVEHDPVQLRAAARDPYEFAYPYRLHQRSVLCAGRSTAISSVGRAQGVSRQLMIVGFEAAGH
jgi:hypothetical protein